MNYYDILYYGGYVVSAIVTILTWEATKAALNYLRGRW